MSRVTDVAVLDKNILSTQNPKAGFNWWSGRRAKKRRRRKSLFASKRFSTG